MKSAERMTMLATGCCALAYAGISAGLFGVPRPVGDAADGTRFLPWLCLEWTALGLWVAWRSSGRDSFRGHAVFGSVAASTAFLAAHVVAAVILGLGLGSALLLQLFLGLGVIVVAAGVRALIRMGSSPALAQIVVTSATLAGWTAPLWANPVVEHSLVGPWRGGLIRALLATNPVAAGSAVLGVDWLRCRVAYETGVIGRFYPFEYPDTAGFVIIHAIMAVLLVGVASIPTRRRTPPRNGRAGGRTGPPEVPFFD